jgi:hypothetical protein
MAEKDDDKQPTATGPESPVEPQEDDLPHPYKGGKIVMTPRLTDD